jgi:hypothetical protein
MVLKCDRKRELYVAETLTILNSSDITWNTVKLAKTHYHNKLITNSKNKIKATWGIIRSVTDAKTNNKVITSVSNEGKSYKIINHKLWPIILITL